MKSVHSIGSVAGKLAFGLCLAASAGCGDLDSALGGGSSSQSPAAPELAIVLIWDPTITASANSEEAKQVLGRLLGSQAVPRGTPIAIVKADADPTIVYDGVKANRDRLLAGWEEAQHSRLQGTDQIRAYQTALDWFSAPEQSRAKRKIIIAWTDNVPDPFKKGTRVVRTPTAPVDYKWPNARALGVELYGLGVDYSTQPKLRRAWTPYFTKEPRFFGPRHDLQLKTLGFELDETVL